jgi:hypothetical protein
LYPSAYALTQTAPRGEPAIAVRNTCRDLWNDFQAMPEQIEAFGPWFARHSPAAQVAARERRSVSAPTARQLYALWPQFAAWYAAQQRRTQRPMMVDEPVVEERRARLSPDEVRRLREMYEQARRTA